MSLDVGFNAQVPSLPTPGGATSSLGETFAPEPSTGTADFTIRIDTPNGPNDIGPRLALHYEGGAGNGPFGLGFSLRLPRIVRSLAHGVPTYTHAETLMLEGAGELLALPDGTLQPIVEAGAWRIRRQGDGFLLTDREGTQYTLGVAPEARQYDQSVEPAGGAYAWHLERIEDALGHAATFSWTREDNQLYLAGVAYGPYQVVLDYESRPDVLRWGRCGFLVTTRRRCTRIELHLPRDAQPLLRQWDLRYAQHEGNGASVLAQVVLSGIDAQGRAVQSPPLTMGWSTAGRRTLSRMTSRDGASQPGPLQHTGQRAELIDWSGSGLPDLLEISGSGQARVWANLGNLTWDRPRSLGALPMFATPEAGATLVDLDGDGLADLVRTDVPLSSFVPRTREGFQRPVALSHAPAVALDDPGVRLTDADGDGIVDMMVAQGDTVAIYYRSQTQGWSPTPQFIAGGPATAALLSDPHVYLADMTGSGGSDLVRVDGGGVTYWPALGRGRYANPVVMATPPVLPFDFVPGRAFLQDIDGDGCADLIYLDRGRLLYWINQGGCSFSDMRSINFLPVGGIDQTRWADMTGLGVNGLLWSAELAGRIAYFFVDFVGGRRPYLLESFDNGCGLVTAIEYSTSAREAARDRQAGAEWSTALPVVVPVVASVEARDSVTGTVGRTEYRYHEGRYDGVLREFAGFGRVEALEIGDETAPSLRQTTWFHQGLNADGGEPRTRDERMARRALRGRMLRQERTSPDGSPVQDRPFDRVEQDWTVVTASSAPGSFYRPRLLETRKSVLDRAEQPATVHTTTNVAWDADGNVTDCVETFTAPAAGLPSETIRTHCDFAIDAARRFLSLPARLHLFDGDGNLLSDTLTQYDHAPEGQVGVQGLVTRRQSLALTDAMVTDLYGDTPPDFASLGYVRRAGEDGWWVIPATYTRIDDDQGLRGTTTDAMGAVSTFRFDPDRVYPVAVTDPMGNVTTAVYDARLARPTSVSDGGGATHALVYDPLARLVRQVDAIDTDAFPTLLLDYPTDTLPLSVVRRQRAVTGAAATLASRTLYDASGRVIEQREADGAGEVAVASRRHGARGFVTREWRPFRRPSGLYGDPGDAALSTRTTCDALGRPLRIVNPDGSARTMTYAGLLVVEADEEDNRAGSDAPHRDTPTRRFKDARGRVVAIERYLAGRVLRSSYTYDGHGKVALHIDESGHAVAFRYDLLGRQLRMLRPERQVTVVRDAAGRPVQTRTAGMPTVYRTFDALGRLADVRLGAPDSPPVHRLTYHDTGAPPPPDAGAHTGGGRLVRVDDEAGTTVFDYDAVGRQVHRAWNAAGRTNVYVVDAEYRSDGRLGALVYPDGGAGRVRVVYTYDERARLVAVPLVLPRIEVDLAGQVTRLEHANGVTLDITVDEATLRPVQRVLGGPDGWRRATTYAWDLVGNLLSIGSDDDKLAATYAYDDLYRLVTADTPLGEHREYRYADDGSLAFKSDIGAYVYGGGGAAATCLTSAGAMNFAYSPAGDMTSAPWGEQGFDALGRLRTVARDGSTLAGYDYDWNGRRAISTSVDAAGNVSSRLTPTALFSIEDDTLVIAIYAYDQIVARVPAGAPATYLHLDHQGSVVATSDDSGALAGTLRYDSYGQVLEATGTASAQRAGYTGAEFDAPIGLLYLQARYYHPGLGIFLSSDPLVRNASDPDAWAAYAYCGGNPTSRVDPTGMSFSLVKLAVGVLAVTALVALAIATSGSTTGAEAELVLAAAEPESASVTLTAATAAAMNAGAPTAFSTYVTISAFTGGLIGGVSVAREEGGKLDAGDLLVGIAFGAAVSGWATFATVFGPVQSGKIVGDGIGGLATKCDVLSGALNNTVTQLAYGFAHSVAKPLAGTGKPCEFLLESGQSLIAGSVSGGLQAGLLGAFTPKLSTLYTPWREVAAAQLIVGAEQFATSQVDWHHEAGKGTLENTLIGGVLDMGAAMGGFYVQGGWGVTKRGLPVGTSD